MITYENGVFALQGDGFTCLLRVNSWNRSSYILAPR